MLNILFLFLLLAGWIAIETYCYLLIGRSLKQQLQRYGTLSWILLLPLLLVVLYFLGILILAFV